MTTRRSRSSRLNGQLADTVAFTYSLYPHEGARRFSSNPTRYRPGIPALCSRFASCISPTRLTTSLRGERGSMHQRATPMIAVGGDVRGSAFARTTTVSESSALAEAAAPSLVLSGEGAASGVPSARAALPTRHRRCQGEPPFLGRPQPSVSVSRHAPDHITHIVRNQQCAVLILCESYRRAV